MLGGLSLIWLVACSSPPPVGPPTIIQPAQVVPPALPAELIVSVLPFDDRGKQAELVWLRKGMTDLLVSELAHVQHVTVVQRDRLEEVVREQALQLSGRVDEASAVQVGRLTGASVLMAGSFAVAGATIRMDVQMIGVERGIVLDTASAEGPVSDPLAVGKSLTSAVLARLHAAPGHRLAEHAATKGFAEAVTANETGDTKARAGKLFQALEEYEKSIGAHPGYGPARANYSATVRALSGRDLTKDFQVEAVRDRRRVATRLAERLAAGGLKAEIGRVKIEAGDEGLVATVPVVLSADPTAIEAVSEMTTRMGGAIDRRPASPDRVILDFTQAAAVGREVTRQLSIPRRAFLRLLSREGRAVAVLSAYRDWQLSRWYHAADDIHVLLEQGRRTESLVKIGGLTEEEARRIERAEVLVEPVAQERALVRVEYAEDLGAVVPDRQAHVYHPGRKSDPAPAKPAKPDEPGPKPGELMQKLIGEQWNPPVTAHGVGSAALPGNLRTATIALTIEENGDVIAPPRILTGSGESLFDDAALDAVSAAIPHWMRARQVVGPVAGAPRFVDRPGRLRISFQLVKDMPAVNVVSPLAGSRTLSHEQQPLSSAPASDSPR